MVSFLSALPLLLCLFSVCTASRYRNRHTTLPNSNRTLTRRDIEPATVSDLYSIGTSTTAGGCSSKSAIIDTWIVEAILLHDAVETAFDEYKSDLGIRALFSVYMGIRFTADGNLLNTDVNEFNWNAIEGHVQAVSQFLAGAGLIDPVDPSPPWIFCDETFAEYAPYDQPAKSSDGNYIAISLDETTGQPDEYLTIDDIFPGMESEEISVFYIDQFKAYTLDKSGKNTVCEKADRYAATHRPSTMPNNNGYDVTFGSFGEYTWFCPQTFEPEPGSGHSGPPLATSISYEGYPEGLITDPLLDRYVPISATFYHELYHLTDYRQTTSDPYYPLPAVLDASLYLKPGISTNPESYVFFAMALYMYFNPPATPEGSPVKEAVLFLGGGSPRVARKVFDGTG